MDTTGRQKISKDMEKFTITIYQQNLLDVCRTLHPIRAECTFFLSTHSTYTKINYKLGHKINFDKFKNLKELKPHRVCSLITKESD